MDFLDLGLAWFGSVPLLQDSLQSEPLSEAEMAGVQTGAMFPDIYFELRSPANLEIASLVY